MLDIGLKLSGAMSYKKLEIWQEARELSIKIHEMSLSLPKFEQFEEAQQIRRSIKSVRSNIVEGHGRRRYKQDFTRFLITALASNDETIDHLEVLFETKSFSDKLQFEELLSSLNRLGRKINNFLKAVDEGHNDFPDVVQEPVAKYSDSASVTTDKNQESSIQNQESSIQNQESSI
jgi:four helix bundle protein